MDNATILSHDSLQQVLELLLAEERARLSMCSPMMHRRVLLVRSECFKTSVKLLSGHRTIPQWTKSVILANHVIASKETMASLPNSVVSLTMPYVRYCDKSSPFQCLPPSLTHLNLMQNQILQYAYSPSGTISNRCYVTRGCTYDLSFWRTNFLKHLPRALRHLRISDNVGIWSFLVKDLPPELRILELPDDDSLSDDDILQLPPKLTHLDLHSNDTLTGACAKNLPRDLTHLDLCCNMQFSKECMAHFPRNLRLLKLSCDDGVIVTDLPPGLAHLELLGLRSNLADEDILDLPRTLTHLRVTLSPYLSSAAFRHLPDKMTYLSLCGDWNIRPDDVLCLPPCLTYLEFQMNRNLNNSCLANLSSNLMHLHIDYNNLVTDAGIKLLPRGLLSLSMKSNNKLTNSAIPHLPSGLTRLVMSSNKRWTDSFVPHLPRGLLHLNVASNKNFSDICIPHLPKGLISLNMLSSTNMTDISVAQLPRGLTFLDWGHVTGLTNEAIKDLPRELIHLDLASSRQLTTAAAKSLPPKLSVLFWNPKAASVDDSAVGRQDLKLESRPPILSSKMQDCFAIALICAIFVFLFVYLCLRTFLCKCQRMTSWFWKTINLSGRK